MTCLLFAVFGLQGGAQTVEPDASVRKYFRQYQTKGYAPASAIGIDSLRTEISLHEIRIYANEAFCSQSFTPEKVKQIYAELQRVLPAPYNAYRITVVNKKAYPLKNLCPISYAPTSEMLRDFGAIYATMVHLGYKICRSLIASPTDFNTDIYLYGPVMVVTLQAMCGNGSGLTFLQLLKTCLLNPLCIHF